MTKRAFLIPSLLMAGFAASAEAEEQSAVVTVPSIDGTQVSDAARQLFRSPQGFQLAQHRSHRSHRSHSSHSSHRSSTTGRGTVYRPPPVYLPPSPPRPAPSTSPRSSTAPSTFYAPAPVEDPFTAKVKLVQRGLLAYGYYSGAIDGQVGPATRSALERFQADFNLTVTGTITPEVLTALGVN